MGDNEFDNFPPITHFSPIQRRVLGVLVEKGLTTPDVYPLTIKATTTGCNQKSNRDPVVEYDEFQVEDCLASLNKTGVVVVVYPDSGRSERFRHMLRKRITINEPQLAILGELLLRGRQSMGDLRARASRMVPIETLEQLRHELQGLLDQKLIQADGPLDRRGVEVDHNWYEPREGGKLLPRPEPPEPPPTRPQVEGPGRASPPVSTPAVAGSSGSSSGQPHAAAVSPSDAEARARKLEAEVSELRQGLREALGEVEALRADLRRLTEDVATLRASLGG